MAFRKLLGLSLSVYWSINYLDPSLHPHKIILIILVQATERSSTHILWNQPPSQGWLTSSWDRPLSQALTAALQHTKFISMVDSTMPAAMQCSLWNKQKQTINANLGGSSSEGTQQLDGLEWKILLNGWFGGSTILGKLHMRGPLPVLYPSRFIVVATAAYFCRGAVHQMQGFHPVAILLAGTYGSPIHHHILSTRAWFAHGRRHVDSSWLVIFPSSQAELQPWHCPYASDAATPVQLAIHHQYHTPWSRSCREFRWLGAVRGLNSLAHSCVILLQQLQLPFVAMLVI